MSTAYDLGRPTALQGKTTLVTGAGRGIGRAVAIGLAEAGVTSVVLLARSADQLAEAGYAVEAAGAKATPITADLMDLDGLPHIINRVLEATGGVDVLINNAAAVAPLGATSDVSTRSFLDAFRLNVVAPMALTALTLPGMRQRGWGRIVNVSSGVADHPTGMIGGNAYVASKAALEAHTLNLAAELDGSCVTVNVYRPGTVDTAMQEWIRDQDPAVIGQQLHDHFIGYRDSGSLITPESSARGLIEHLDGSGSGEVWSMRPAR